MIFEREGLARILAVFPDRKLHVTYDPASPWLLVTVETAWGREATPQNDERKFAIWRETEALYVVQPDESVGDDPIPVGADPREVW